MEVADKVLAHKTTEYLYEDAIATFKETFIDEIRQIDVDYKDHIANQPGFFSKLKQKAERKLFTTLATEGVEQAAQTVGEISGYGAIAKSIGDLATTVIKASTILYFHIKDKKAAEQLKDAKKFSSQLEKLGGEKFLNEAADYLINRFLFSLQEFSVAHQCDIKELSLFFTAALCNILLENISWNISAPKEELYAKLVPDVDDSLFKHTLVINRKFSYQGWTIQGLIHRAPVCTPDGDMYVRPTTDARQDKYPPQRLDEAIAKKSYQLGRLNLQGQSLGRASLLMNVLKGGSLNEWKTACKEFHSKVIQKDKSWESLLSDVARTRDKQRELREELWKTLTQIKNSAKPEKLILSLRSIISDYARCLWVSTYHEVITRNAPWDRIAALWFQLEVAWSALLLKEGRSYWLQNQRKLPRAKSVDKIISAMDDRIKHLGTLAQYVVAKTNSRLKKQQVEEKPAGPSSSALFQSSPKSTSLDKQYGKAFDLYQSGADATNDKFANECFNQAIKELNSLIKKLNIPKTDAQKDLLADAYYLLATCRLGIKDFQAALNDIERTLDFKPKDRDALYLQINLLQCEGDNTKIFAAINSFLSLYPDDSKQQDLLELMKTLQTKSSAATYSK